MNLDSIVWYLHHNWINIIYWKRVELLMPVDRLHPIQSLAIGLAIDLNVSRFFSMHFLRCDEISMNDILNNIHDFFQTKTSRTHFKRWIFGSNQRFDAFNGMVFFLVFVMDNNKHLTFRFLISDERWITLCWIRTAVGLKIVVDFKLNRKKEQLFAGILKSGWNKFEMKLLLLFICDGLFSFIQTAVNEFIVQNLFFLDLLLKWNKNCSSSKKMISLFVWLAYEFHFFYFLLVEGIFISLEVQLFSNSWMSFKLFS